MNLFILKQKFRETVEFTSGNIFCKKQNFCEIRIFQKTSFTISSIFQIKYFFFPSLDLHLAAMENVFNWEKNG